MHLFFSVTAQVENCKEIVVLSGGIRAFIAKNCMYPFFENNTCRKMKVSEKIMGELSKTTHKSCVLSNYFLIGLFIETWTGIFKKFECRNKTVSNKIFIAWS